MWRSGSARDRVETALARKDAVDRPELWISVAAPADLRDAMDEIGRDVMDGSSPRAALPSVFAA